jgi:biopolymer transport protein ExbB/TolQ
MEINLIEIWNSMGLPVRSVVVVLFLQAVASFAVVVDRIILLSLSKSRSRIFAEKVVKLEGFSPETLLKLASTQKGSHLATFVQQGLKSYVELRKAGHTVERSAELTRRALERKAEPLSRELSRGMTVLASTGSTAPFVGLLGTVLGIINAFKMISTTGSGGLGAIGSSIAEALIVTGFGLTVAIPVVLLFNWISSKLTAYEGDILNSAGDLLDRLETCSNI